jgi:cell division protein FtsL
MEWRQLQESQNEILLQRSTLQEGWNDLSVQLEREGASSTVVEEEMALACQY